MNSKGAPRFIASLLLLAIAAGSAAAFLIAAGVLTPGQIIGSWRPGNELASLAHEATGAERGIIVAGSLVVGFVSLGLLLRMLRPQKSRDATNLHMLVVDDQGFVVVDSRGIATVAIQAAVSAHGVVDAEVNVRGSGTSPVRLRADVGVYPGADIKRAGNEARQSIREAVEQLVGIEVRDVSVAVHVLESDALAARLG